MSKFNSSLGFEKIGRAIDKVGAKIHFSGAGGIGMYSLMHFAKRLGKDVTGSDRENSERTEKLHLQGFDVKIAPYLSAIESSDLLVYSLALEEDDPELLRAAELGVPLVSRAEFLSFISKGYKTKIAVSGSHGKSSTTAMISEALSAAGFAPSVISGASLPSGEPYILGGEEYIVMEACEYKDSFLSLSPSVSVFTNLELDHTDYFNSLDDIKRSFAAAARKADTVIFNADDENLNDIIKEEKREGAFSYGINSPCDFKAVSFKKVCGRYSFSVESKGNIIADISLSVYGKHSVYNALAAFSLATLMGVDIDCAARAISLYSGIERRFEIIGRKKSGAPVIYDYAHHPAEIKASISAISDIWQGDTAIVFKPHTYTRTRDLFDGFVDALSGSFRVYISEIDGIREKKIEGVDGASLARAIGDRAEALPDDEIIEKIRGEELAVLIMGAAPLEKIKNAFRDLNKRT